MAAAERAEVMLEKTPAPVLVDPPSEGPEDLVWFRGSL